MIDQGLQILQNGSDIRGIATNGVIGQKITMTPEKVAQLGQGFALWLKQKNPSKDLRIAIGMDGRITGPTFASALQNTLVNAGADVLFCGLATTPAMMQSTILDEIHADGAIMITGSHLSFNQNGMKFFYSGTEVDKDELSEIIRIASEEKTSSIYKGEVHITNLLSIYSKHLRDKICTDLKDVAQDPSQPLAGLKIVVDAGNGAGGFFATKVLKPLGADISGSQFLIPDGRFPNHTPNPEDFEAMRSISAAVLYAKADLGIIFDADVDRSAIVDEEGRALNRNEFVALAAAITLAEHPQTSIVTDSITSTGLGVFIKDVLKSHQCRFQRGYRNVIAEAKRKNDAGSPCWLAVETSGHAAFRENHFCDDGAYLATKVVIKLAQLKHEGKTLFSLIEKLPVPIESKEFRLTILADDFQRAATDTMNGLRQYVSQMPEWEEVMQNHEGLRVMCNAPNENGWFLFRLSLHSPVMPLNIEADVPGGVDAILGKLKRFFRYIHAVDSVCLYNK